MTDRAGGPTVTAIIPVYNGEHFVERAIRSTQLQDEPVSAILVVDDCSTDRTAEVVRALAAADSRIRLVPNDINHGPSYCRNCAMSLTGTSIAAFLDADDAWMPHHVAQIRQAFVTFPKAAVAFGRVVDQDVPFASEALKEFSTLSDPLVRFFAENPIPQSAAAVRVSSFLQVGGYRESARYAEDYDLWVRLALQDSTFVEVRNVTVRRTRHPGQVSALHAHEMYRSAWSIRREAVERRYGAVAAASAPAIEALLQSQSRDFSGALNARRRDLLEVLLSSTQWIPGPQDVHVRTQRLLGWRWPFWRTAAFAYDCLPPRTKRWLRARRPVSAPA